MKISEKLLYSPDFLKLPASARLLFYDLAVTANEYGYINEITQFSKKVNAKPEDYKMLEKKGFIAFSKPLFGATDNYCIQITRTWR